MKAVFADTFYFLAAVNRSDPRHAAAVKAYRQTDSQFVTTAWVLIEFADALAPRNSRAAFISSLRLLRRDPKFRIVALTQELFDRGVELYGVPIQGRRWSRPAQSCWARPPFRTTRRSSSGSATLHRWVAFRRARRTVESTSRSASRSETDA